MTIKTGNHPSDTILPESPVQTNRKNNFSWIKVQYSPAEKMIREALIRKKRQKLGGKLRNIFLVLPSCLPS